AGTAGEERDAHRAVRVPGKRTPEPFRQVFLHLCERGLDDVSVVEQPLGGAWETLAGRPQLLTENALAGALQGPGHGGQTLGRRALGSSLRHEDSDARRDSGTTASPFPESHAGRSWKTSRGVVPWAISRSATLP